MRPRAPARTRVSLFAIESLFAETRAPPAKRQRRDTERRAIVSDDVFEVAAFLVWQELAPEKACGGSKVTLADTGATATVVRLEFTWRCSVDAEVLDVEMHVGTVQGSGTFTPPPSVEKEHDRLHSILYICPITHVGPFQ